MAIDYDAVHEVIAKTQHCVIATASPDGAPWLSTVFFNYSPSYDLIWESTRTARHSVLLAANPRIAIYIGTRDQITGALYASGEAHEVTGPSLQEALDNYLNGPHHRDDPRRTLADYAEGSPIGLYCARIDELYVLSHTKVEGYMVEERQAVDLAKLRHMPSA